MRRFSGTVLAALLCSLAAPGSTMMISEAFDLATEHDPAIPQSLAIYEADSRRGRQVTGTRLPQINAVGEALRSHSEVEGGEFFLGQRAEDTGNRYSASLEVRQPLYRRDWRARGRQASALDSQAEVGREDRIQRLILRVAERYFAVLEEEENLSLARAEQESLRKALQDTRNRHEAGRVAATDLHEARARFDMARARAMRADSALQSAREALHEITRNGFAELPRLSSEAPLPELEPAEAEQWLELAREHSLVLREARQQEEIASAELAARKNDYSPRLDALAGFRYSDSTDFMDGQKREERLVGLELTVPIYQGGSARAARSEASFRHEAARAQLSRATLETERRVRQLHRNVLADRAQVEAAEQSVLSARTAREATATGYREGTRTILDMLDAEARLTDARRDEVQARFAYLLNLLNLRYEAGLLEPGHVRTLDNLLEF